MSVGQVSQTFDEWPLTLIFCPAYNNGGATLTRPMPGQACVFKAFRASLTLVPTRYIAPADAVQSRHLLLGLGQSSVQSVAPPDDIGLPLRQHLRHQPPDELAVLLVLQLLQHGVLLAHHIAEVQGISLRPRLDGVRQRHLPLQLPLRPEVHQYLIRYPLPTDT